jgi:hypothetical protein
MKNVSHGVLALALVSTAGIAQATIFQFDLLGKGGAGLLSTNENGVINGAPGSGGEIGAGIFFDDSTNVLTVNVGWGSANGFTNLSGNATVGHIHGPTASGGVASFTQNAGVRYGLDNAPGWNNSASAGGFIGTRTILAGDVAALFAGRFYINVHTSANTPGEIRGNLVLVPTPSAAAVLGLVGLAGLRRRR